MIKGLEQLKVNAMAGSSRMTEVLLGKQKPATVEDVPDLAFFDTTLNDSQKEAVRFALGAQDISLIHGPPGVSDLNS
jgi:DNA polymerase alpha-associated DNA helicase A